MVRVTIKSEKYDRIEFEFVDCEVAGEFMEVAMNAAVGEVTFEVEKVKEPAEEPQGEPEPPQEESRFEEPELF